MRLLRASTLALVACGSATTSTTPEPPRFTAATSEVAQTYQQCWKLWTTKWTELGSCYDDAIVSEEPGSGSPPWRGKPAVMGHVELFKHVFPDARGDLQLVLVNGSQVASIALVTGTHAGAMKRPGGEIAPTNKRIGLFLAHAQELGADRRSTSELIFLDHAALWGQLGLFRGPHRSKVETASAEPAVVIAANDAVERANLEAFKRRIEHLNAHDARAVASGLADDAVWSDFAIPADLDKRSAVALFENLWRGFSDLRFTVRAPWAAGDYVVAVGSMDGTNDGEVPMMGLGKTGRALALPYLEIVKFRDGKVVSSWMFYDGLGLIAQLGLAPS